jgi:putative ATP-binding cassette transporter
MRAMATTITANTFRLAAPHWLRAQHRYGSWALGALLVGLVGLMTSLNYWMNQLMRQYMDALQAHDAAAFNASIWNFLGAVLVLITVMAFNRYAEQALEIRWRTDLTESTMARWLTGHTFYRMERDKTCDNPDQRISQDVTEYVRLMILLVLGFIGNLGTLGSMGWVLWQTAGAVRFDLAGGAITIQVSCSGWPLPGVWCAPSEPTWLATGWLAQQSNSNPPRPTTGSH